MVGTLRVEDRLEGATNFRAWKARIIFLLEENDLKDNIEMVIPHPNDVQELAVLSPILSCPSFLQRLLSISSSNIHPIGLILK
jgi:hypothetical protein